MAQVRRLALFLMATSAMVGAGAYLGYRLLTFALGSLNPLAYLFAFLLLFGESFFIVQTIGYNSNLLRSVRYAQRPAETGLPPHPPAVAVFVAAYNEPPAVLEETLQAANAIRYPRKRVYLLDDSTDPSARKSARDVARRHGVTLLQRDHRRGYKAGAINDALGRTEEPLFAVLDADQRPHPEFLEELVPLLLQDDRLAFVQTPQFYANHQESRVALAAEFQHVSFFEHVSEGKHVRNAMFFCGTNSLLRRVAVEGIGGLFEGSVTEDIATSFFLHMEGWKSIYYNRVLVEGQGPATLGAYFDQQYRWAVGSLSLLGTFLRSWVTRHGALSRAQWREYFLSFTWWLVGPAQLALLWIPIAFLLFGIPVLGADPLLYLAAALPFLVFPSLNYYATLKERGYSARGLWLSQALTLVAFPVYLRALVDVVRGKRIAFGVTPKGSDQRRLPWRSLWPQITMFALTFAAIAVALGAPLRQEFLLVGVVTFLALGVLGVWHYMSGVERPRAEEHKRMPWSKLGALAGAAILFVGVLGLLSYFQLPIPQELQDLPQPRDRDEGYPPDGPPPWAGQGNAPPSSSVDPARQPAEPPEPEEPPEARDPFEPPPPQQEGGDVWQELYRRAYPYLLAGYNALKAVRDFLAVRANQALVLNVFWAFYNLLFLAGTFLFNQGPRPGRATA